MLESTTVCVCEAPIATEMDEGDHLSEVVLTLSTPTFEFGCVTTKAGTCLKKMYCAEATEGANAAASALHSTASLR